MYSFLQFLLFLFLLMPSAAMAATDVTDRVELKETKLVYLENDQTSFTVVAVKNISDSAIWAPIKVVLSNITYGVEVENPDGYEDGNPYFEYSTKSDFLYPKKQTKPKNWRFNNPDGLAVSYDFIVKSDPVIVITGKAVAGVPVVGTINIKDSSVPAQYSFSAINSDGSYTLNIDETWTSPFLMWAEGWVNDKQVRLLSTFELEQGETEANINTTPATTAIIESAIGESASEIDPATAPVPDQDVITQIQAVVQETLAAMFAVLGVSEDFNLFESPIGEVGSPEDQLYDTLSFSTDEKGNIIVADAMDDTHQVVIDPDGDAVDPSDEMLTSIAQTGDALTQIRQILTDYFSLYEGGSEPKSEELNSMVKPHLADGFLNSGYGPEDFIQRLSQYPNTGLVNQRLIGCGILRPMTTQYYGNISVKENHDNYYEAVWVVVTSEISDRNFTWLTAFVKDSTEWKWYGNRDPFMASDRARPRARQLLYPAGAVTYLSGLHLWFNDIGNLASDRHIKNLAVFNPAFAPESIDGHSVNCVRLERRGGGFYPSYRLSNVPHYWNDDALYELRKEPGDRLIDLDNLKSQETMEFVVIGLDDDYTPIRTWLYTIPEAPLPVSEIEADPDRYFAGIEHNVISFDPFPGNDGMFSWTLPENPEIFPSFAILGWDNENWHWNELRLMNPAWYGPLDFSEWTSDLFDIGSLAEDPRTGNFVVVSRDNNHRHYRAQKRYYPWSENLIRVDNDHLIFDVNQAAENLNYSSSNSFSASTRIRGKYLERFEAPFVIESASAEGNASVETEIRLAYQPDEDLWNGSINFIGVWARISYQDGGLKLKGFVWGSRDANATDEFYAFPAHGNFPYERQLSFNENYHLAVEYLEDKNQLMIEFRDDTDTYQSFYDIGSIENFEFDPDNFLYAEIRTRIRGLKNEGDRASMKVLIDETRVDGNIYDDFTGGFSNNKWDITVYE
jgi:hypothetical protein